mmetsp:Transcript_25420/g.88707  ORF Transcript_25420/g.88707 Transcript_25420/m.88707 type:complete len:263 (+) Transcript_25420:1454-2242(+)
MFWEPPNGFEARVVVHDVGVRRVIGWPRQREIRDRRVGSKRRDEVATVEGVVGVRQVQLQHAQRLRVANEVAQAARVRHHTRGQLRAARVVLQQRELHPRQAGTVRDDKLVREPPVRAACDPIPLDSALVPFDVVRRSFNNVADALPLTPYLPPEPRNRELGCGVPHRVTPLANDIFGVAERDLSLEALYRRLEARTFRCLRHVAETSEGSTSAAGRSGGRRPRSEAAPGAGRVPGGRRRRGYSSCLVADARWPQRGQGAAV